MLDTWRKKVMLKNMFRALLLISVGHVPDPMQNSSVYFVTLFSLDLLRNPSRSPCAQNGRIMRGTERKNNVRVTLFSLDLLRKPSRSPCAQNGRIIWGFPSGALTPIKLITFSWLKLLMITASLRNSSIANNSMGFLSTRQKMQESH